MANTIQIKRGLQANLPASLLSGELAFTTDQHEVYIGDGSTKYRIDFTGTERTKLSGIETSADVTDFTNVSAALAAASGSISVNSQKITSLADPTASGDAVNKGYVDLMAAGLDFKGSCRLATTENVDLSSDLANEETLDGKTIATGDRILVKDQTDASKNGIYVAPASGAASRSSDADTSTEVTAGMWVVVEDGTANADTGWLLTTNNPIELGTTDLVFTQFPSNVVQGATLALDNLSEVAINAALILGTAGAYDLGSGTKPWKYLFVSGDSETAASNNFKITGTSSNGTKTITLPSDTATLMSLGLAESVTGAKTFDKDKILMKGTSTGCTTFSTANTSASNYTVTFPALAGNVLLDASTIDGGSF